LPRDFSPKLTRAKARLLISSFNYGLKVVVTGNHIIRDFSPLKTDVI